MTYVIVSWGFANGAPCPHVGQFVETFDHDAYEGRGYGEFTPDPRRAMQFATAGEAMEFWKRRSRKKPTRTDGRPNRPLTSMHASFVSMEQAENHQYMEELRALTGKPAT